MSSVMRQDGEKLDHFVECAQPQRGADGQEHQFAGVIRARMRGGEHHPAGEHDDEAHIGVREVVVHGSGDGSIRMMTVR